jgi:hypothetical protein
LGDPEERTAGENIKRNSPQKSGNENVKFLDDQVGKQEDYDQ